MDNHHRSTVAQGWILMFLALICIFLTEFATNAIDGNLAMFRTQEGSRMLRLMVFLMVLHAFIPMLVVTVSASWFRWTVMGVTACLTTLMILHEIGHLIVGNKPFGIFHLLDFSHHALGIWVTIVAMRWAKQGQRIPGTCAPQASALQY